MPSRARGRSPLASIIHYVLTAPIAEARQGLEAAKAALQAREEVVPQPVRRRAARGPLPPPRIDPAYLVRADGTTTVLPLTGPGEVAGMPAPQARVPQARVLPGIHVPKKRARRSDAGQPRPSRRKAPAGAQPAATPFGPPVRRRRPAVPVATALNVGRVQPDPLPDSFVPPDAEDAV